MINEIDAYNILKKRIPDLKCNIVSDWGDFYSISNAEEGDLIDDDWKIDKRSGIISVFSIDDMSKELQKHSDDCSPTGYEI